LRKRPVKALGPTTGRLRNPAPFALVLCHSLIFG
jgi:hypothetical protein